MAILKLPAIILYYNSDKLNKICKIVSLYVSIQIADRIITGKSDIAIVHSWIRHPKYQEEDKPPRNRNHKTTCKQ